MKKHLIYLKNQLPAKKNTVVYKILGIILLVFAMNFSLVAAGESLLSERIHLRVDNVTLKDALKEIEKQSEFTFLYNDASINVNQTVSVSASELSIKELLDEVLDNKGINYTIIDNQIVLTKAFKLQDEKITVSGLITDSESGDGLPGVTIVEKGTSNGTITDLDGNYTLSVDKDATLQISYVGYVTEEILVGGQTSINMSLIPDIISLDDVVVIGYGTVKKSDLTGAVASISAEELNQAAVSGLDQALQGRTAGVSVTSNTGTPGGPAMVRIRGMGTITDPDPLFVVDGIPMRAEDVSALNPGDIESTEILKDASAAAIYGTRAANGVVMITTKKGKAGQSSITYDGYEGVQMLAKKIDLLSAEDYVALREEVGLGDDTATASTDWQDEIFRTARIRKHQLSFLGGTENVQYAFTGSYYNQEGIIRGSDYERYTLRANTSANIKPWLTIGENLSYMYSKQNRVPEQNEWTSVAITSLTMDPALDVFLPDSIREEETNPYSHYSTSNRNNVRNPVGIIDRNHNITKSNKLLGNVFVDIKPIDWIVLRTSLGAEITNRNNEQFFPVFYESADNNQGVNNLFQGDFKTNHLVWENTATFKKTFAEKHQVQVLAGYTRESTTYRLFTFAVQQVPEDPVLWYASNSGVAPENNTFLDITSGTVEGVGVDPPAPYDHALVSYLGRVIYSYGNLFDFTGSIRRDGSSRFTGDKKWGYFPSFAAGLKISEFGFFQNVGFINFLKIRAGWGKLGNQEIGDYGAYTNVEYEMDYTFGLDPNQIAYIGGAPTRIGNTNLFWEETEMTNIGLDVNFFENKLSLNVDAYKRVTKDMLAEVPIPLVVGVQDAPWVNRGEVENLGLEFNLIHKNKIGELSYTISGNIAFVKNEVTVLPVDIPAGSFRASQYASMTSEGQPIASFYGWVTDGYWQNQAEIDAANAGAPDGYYDTRNTSPGDVKFVDINGDGEVTGDDRTFIGNPHPKFTYGLSIDVQYKFVDLKIFGQGVYGNDIFFGPLYYLESPTAYWNMLSTMNDYWQEEGDNSAVPRLDRNNTNDNMRFSDRYIRDGSYFRIKNLQIGFTMPKEWSGKIMVDNIRLYLAAQNLLTISKYPGFDPEIGRGNDQTNGSGVLDIGIDRGYYPLARSYMVGLTLTF